MNTKSILIGTMALILGGSVLAAPALAYRGDPSVQGPNYSAKRHEEMTKAFDNNDYNAWKNLMQGKGKATQVITKDNFAKFAQAHKLSLQGKTEEANKIRAELGLGLHNGTGMGQGMGYGRTK